MDKKALYFLCTGNSARSQIAEGFARFLGSEMFDVYSAGTHPSSISPYAIEVMREVGIDISSQSSDAIDPDILNKAHIVITLCGDAKENCPVVPGDTEIYHWPLPDPGRGEATEEGILSSFRQIRDEIQGLVEELVKDEIKKWA